MSWYETIKLHLGVLIFCLLLFLTATMAGIVRPSLRVLQQRNSHLPQLTWVRSIAGLVGILNLTFIVGLPLYLWRWGAWKLVDGVGPVAVG